MDIFEVKQKGTVSEGEVTERPLTSRVGCAQGRVHTLRRPQGLRHASIRAASKTCSLSGALRSRLTASLAVLPDSDEACFVLLADLYGYRYGGS